MREQFASSHTYDKVVFYIVSSYIILSFPLTLLRLSGNYFIPILILNLFLVTFIALGLLRAITCLHLKLFSPLYLAFTVVFIVYILAVGFWSGNENPGIGIKYFMLSLVMYFVVFGTTFYQSILTSKKLWYFVLLGHLLGYIYYLIVLRGSIYPGIGVQSIGYAGFFFLFSGKYVAALGAILLLVLEQKRSLLLSFFVTAFLVYFLRNKNKSDLISILKSVVVVSILGSALLAFISTLEPGPLVNRINLINPFSSQFAPFLGSSGRLGEIVSFFEVNSLGSLVFGKGSGFDYIWDLGYTNQANGEVKHYFHLSIMNYLAAGGILGLSYFIYLGLRFRSISKIKQSVQLSNTMRSFAMFSIIQSFFGFNTAVDPILWITILAPLAMLSLQQRNNTLKPA